MAKREFRVKGNCSFGLPNITGVIAYLENDVVVYEGLAATAIDMYPGYFEEIVNLDETPEEVVKIEEEKIDDENSVGGDSDNVDGGVSMGEPDISGSGDDTSGSETENVEQPDVKKPEEVKEESKPKTTRRRSTKSKTKTK